MLVLVAGFGYYFAGKTLQPIETIYKRQKKFIADAAHELRTPLTVMRTGAETILSGNSTKEDYCKLTKDSLEEVAALSLMVDDMLFLAQNDDWKQPALIRADLRELVHKQIVLMKSTALKKKIIFKEELEDGFIHGNKLYLKRLLANLLQNAIIYNKRDGIVHVSLRNEKKELVLTVLDTGIGISGEDLPYIFDRFYKVDQARMKDLSGAGLGLSLVWQIAQLHSGQISIQSQVDKGTSVRISFPAS